MVSFRLSLMRGQVDAFHKAIHEFVARLESESEDFVFMNSQPLDDPEMSVVEITTGEEATLYACLDHLQGRVKLPSRAL